MRHAPPAAERRAARRGVNRHAVEPAAASSKRGYAIQKIATMNLNLWNDESGISSVEYALLLAFVAAGIITAAELLSNVVENEMTSTAACIENGAC
jgi:Flp pilus assembly pilin Flp